MQVETIALASATPGLRHYDVISMIGSSSSGKSSFLRCLNLLEQPHAGRIVVAGEVLQPVPDRAGAPKARDPAALQRLRTRVTMARALVMEAQLMLFDEPTSALDP